MKKMFSGKDAIAVFSIILTIIIVGYICIAQIKKDGDEFKEVLDVVTEFIKDGDVNAEYDAEIVNVDEWYDYSQYAVDNLISSYTLKIPKSVYDAYGDAFSGYGVSSFDFYEVNDYYIVTVTAKYSIYDEIRAHLIDGTIDISDDAKYYDAYLDSTLSFLNPIGSQYDKCKILHDYLITKYSYDTSISDNVSSIDSNNQDSFSFVGLIKNNKGVCSAYSEMFALMCKKVGIDCECCDGFANANGQNTPHEWNELYISDSTNFDIDTPVYVDVTFDDPVYTDGTINTTPTYNYFMISKAEIEKDHTFS